MPQTSSTLAFRKEPDIKKQITISLLPQTQKKRREKTKKQKQFFSFKSVEKKAKSKTKIKLEEIYVFANQFSTLLDAGVPLITSLSILVQQTENEDFKIIIEKNVQDINEGATLSQSISKYPNVFSNLFVSMVRAAEKGGNMAQVLKQLSHYLREQYELERRIKAAIVYPKFVFFFFVFVLLAIVFGLVPKFKSIFESFNAQLPLPTQILLNISEFAKSHLISEIVIIIFVVFLFKHYKKTKSGRYFMDKMILKIPLVGDLIVKSSLSKFCRTLSVLMQSGASLADSLDIAGNTTQNILFNQAFQNVKKGIMEGRSIQRNLSENPIFPPLMVKMVSVGEESGNLDKMLNKISEMYDAHVDSKISGLSSIIEPALMVGLGATALVVIIALYLPIFKISGAIQ